MPFPKKSKEANGELATLTGAIGRLSDQVQVLREAVDDFRTDFQWAVHNRPSMKVPRPSVLKRMAADPCALDWAERLHIERPTAAACVPESEPQATLTDSFIEDVGHAISHVATEQLELTLEMLDRLRAALISTIREGDIPDDGLRSCIHAANPAHDTVVPRPVVMTKAANQPKVPASVSGAQQKRLWPEDQDKESRHGISIS